MLKRAILLLGVWVGVASTGWGANFLINISGLGDGNGGLAPQGSTLMGVVSTTDAAHTDPTVGDFVGGSTDDFILFTKELTGAGSLTGTSGDIKFADHTNFDTSDPGMILATPT